MLLQTTSPGLCASAATTPLSVQKRRAPLAKMVPTSTPRISQAAQHSRQIHFGLSCLQAVFHSGFDQVLRLGVAQSHSKNLGVTAEVLCRRERNRVDPIFDCDVARSRETGDSKSQRSYEIH